MILGIGTDIVNKHRIKQILNNFPNTFAKKILSNLELRVFEELANLEQKVAYLAKRFAAKESIAKSIGAGIGALGLKNLQVLNHANGKPYVRILTELGKFFPACENVQIDISISDEKEYAVAFALAHRQ